MTSKSFPPSKVADLDRRSASTFLTLLKASHRRPLTLVVGAGVSASAGLPEWNTLLRRIAAAYFYHWQFAMNSEASKILNPPMDMSIAFFSEEFWDDQAEKLAAGFVQQDALLVAQQIRNCIRARDWSYLVRKTVYNADIYGGYRISESLLINELASYCASASCVRAVISYNWDNLLELKLRELGLRCVTVWNGQQRLSETSLPVYYPHGNIALAGGPVTPVVLAESDYHRESTEAYSWANLIQLNALCGSSCVFVGTSMTDPNLRRLLDVTSKAASGPHFAFLPTVAQQREEHRMYQALFDYDLHRLGIKVIRYPLVSSGTDPYARLPELIRHMTEYIADKESIWK